MTAWFDVGKSRVVVVFKRAIHIKLCPVIQFKFNHSALCCIYCRRSYEHGISLRTVYSVQHQINSLIYGHLQCLALLPPTRRLCNTGVCLFVAKPKFHEKRISVSTLVLCVCPVKCICLSVPALKFCAILVS